MMIKRTKGSWHLHQNVDRENSNKIKQEEGALAVAHVKAQTQNVRLQLRVFPDTWLTSPYRLNLMPTLIVLSQQLKLRRANWRSRQRHRLRRRDSLLKLMLRPSESGQMRTLQFLTNLLVRWSWEGSTSAESGHLVLGPFSYRQKALAHRLAMQWRSVWPPEWEQTQGSLKNLLSSSWCSSPIFSSYGYTLRSIATHSLNQFIISLLQFSPDTLPTTQIGHSHGKFLVCIPFVYP